MLRFDHGCGIQVRQIFFGYQHFGENIEMMKLQELFLRFFVDSAEGQKTLAHDVHIGFGARKSDQQVYPYADQCALTDLCTRRLIRPASL